MRPEPVRGSRAQAPTMISAALLLAGMLTSARASAQPAAPPVVFLEKAYFSLLTPTGKDLLFEGRPTAHYFLYNGLAHGDWQKKGGWRFAVPVSEMFVARMTDTTSSPVLTPSYRIRPLFVQAIHLARPSSSSTRYRLFEIGVGATHYSNGQHGCTFEGFEKNATDDCVAVDPALAAQRRANTLDGDFSTSYVSLSTHYRRGQLRTPFDPMVCQVTVGAEYQEHPLGMRPGGINREQASVWGRRQASAMAEGELRVFEKRAFAGVARVAGEYLQRFGGGITTPIRAGWMELSYVFDNAYHVGGFARQHWGSDDYNIQFQNRASYLSVGVMWDVGRLDSLNSDVARTPVSEPRCRLFRAAPS